MSTDGRIERGLAHAKPDLSLEPLPVILDQGDKGNRGWRSRSFKWRVVVTSTMSLMINLVW
jgi:hypothetical protein